MKLRYEKFNKAALVHSIKVNMEEKGVENDLRTVSLQESRERDRAASGFITLSPDASFYAMNSLFDQTRPASANYLSLADGVRFLRSAAMNIESNARCSRNSTNSVDRLALNPLRSVDTLSEGIRRNLAAVNVAVVLVNELNHRSEIHHE